MKRKDQRCSWKNHDTTTQGSESLPPPPQIHSIKLKEQDLHCKVKRLLFFIDSVLVFPFAPDFPVHPQSCTSGLTHRYSSIFFLLTVSCPGLFFLWASSGEYGLPSLHTSFHFKRWPSQGSTDLSPDCVGRGWEVQEARVWFPMGKQELFTDKVATHSLPQFSV